MQEDIQDVVRLATTPPEEAAKNIDRSQLFNIPPDNYVELKSQLDPEAEALERAPAADVTTAKYMKQSPQHASLAKEDTGILDYVSRQAKFIWQNVTDVPNNAQEIIKLRNKEMDEGIDDNERQILEGLNVERQELAQRNYGIDGTLEQLPAQVLAAGRDIVEGAVDNAALVGGFTAAGAGAGALAGLGIPLPFTSAVGVVAGGTTGLVSGITAAGFIKGYQDTRGTFFNELSYAKDEQGADLNLSNEMKTNISHGVALVSGVAGAFVGNKLAKNSPLLKNFLSPSAAVGIINNPALRAKMDILGYMAKSALAGGGGASVSELARIVGEEFAQSDKSDASFENILSKVTEKGYLERIGKATLIGAAAAGTIAGATSAPMYGKMKGRYTDINNRIGAILGEDNTIVVRDDGSYSIEPKMRPSPTQDQGTQIPFRPGEEPTSKPVATEAQINNSTKVLQTQDTLKNMAKATNATQMKKLSPAELANFNKMAFGEAGEGVKFWVTKEDMQAFANNEDKGAAIRNKIDPSGLLNSQIGAPIAIEPHKFLEIVEQFPEVSDYVRMNPDGPNPKEAKTFLERVQDAQVKREEILSSLGVDKTVTSEQQDIVAKALTSVQEATQPFNESEYYDRPTFTQAIEGILSDEEVQTYNTAQLDARLAVAESLKSDVDRAFKIKENAVFRQINEEQIKQELIEHDAALNIINEFQTKKKNAFYNELSAGHNELGVKASPYAIDPRYLPDNLREAYVSDPVLQKRKVFAVGGLSPDEAATLLKVDTGENLLKILANTPDRKDIVKRREQLKIELKNQIQQGYKPEKMASYEEAFTNLTKAHQREMKFMREKNWGETKSGIRRIALPLPSVEELNVKAKGVVSSTAIKDLNERQFIVGERKSQRAAVDHILKNEVEQAYKAKENAALNSELIKETLIAKSRVKKAETFLKKLKDPEVQQELKDAKYLDAINELLDGYNLDLSKRGLTKKGAFQAWAKEQIKSGNVDFTIPDKYNDVRESANELSVEQYLAITDRVQTVVHQAKMKNKLYNKFKEKELLQTEEAIVAASGLILEQHPDFNLKKTTDQSVPTETLSTGQVIEGVFSTLESIFTNAENIVTTLDQEKLGGFHHELLIKPLKDAANSRTKDIADFVDYFKKNITAYGEKEFNKNFTERLYIPELANFPDLGLGHMPRRNLLTLLAYMGDPYTRERMSNYVGINGERLSADSLMRVLETHLTDKDAAFVQNMMLNSFKSYEKRSFDLHFETTGEEPRMVKGQPFTFKGKVYDGGYFPAKYRFTSDDAKINKVIIKTMKKVGALFGGGEGGELYAQLKAAEMTEQGRFEARTGSTRPLDSNFNNFINEMEATLHDLNFRKPGIDTLKLLKNPVMAKNIKATVGSVKYKTLVNSAIEVIGELEAKNSNYYSDQQRVMDDILNFQDKGFALTVLSANISSIAIQPLSLVSAVSRMGATGPMYVGKAASKIASNLHMYSEVRKIAEELNPSIKYHKDGIDDTLVKSAFNFLPTHKFYLKKYKKTGSALNLLKSGQDFSMNFLMSGLSEADAQLKMVVTLGAYDQFINGDVENFPKEKLAKMSETEKFERAKQYVAQLSRLTLTSSAIDDKSFFEKLPTMRFFNKFWTDSRSQMNTQLSMGRKIKWGGKKAYQGFKEGDYKKTGEGVKYAAGSLATLMIASAMTKLVADIVRGQENPTDDLKDINTQEDFNDFAKKTLGYFTTAAPETFLEVTPVARDMLYSYTKKSRSDYKNVQMPMMKYYSDVTTGISGLADLLDFSQEDNVSSVEMKAMLMSAGYITGGLPINGAYKVKKYLESEDAYEAVNYAGKEAKRLNKNIDAFIEKFKDDKDAQDYIEDLKQIQIEVLPKYDNDVTKVIPETTKDTFKAVLSNGQWNKLDPQTGAAGVYQFTEERWNEIKTSAPDLALTDNGRVSQSPAQQEKALDWELKDNARGLIAYDLPVTEENLLGAHKFGFDNYVNILTVDETQKLSEVLGDEANNPVFDSFETVKSVKDYLSKFFNKGRNPSSLPDGWGRSVVNGVEILTPPSGSKKSNKTRSEKIQDEVDYRNTDRSRKSKLLDITDNGNEYTEEDAKIDEEMDS